MSLDSQLIHTCTIETPLPGGNVNAYNNAAPRYDAPIDAVRCRLVEIRERVWGTERQESTAQTVYKLLVMPDARLDERARISKVRLEDGTVIADAFVVTAVLARRRGSAHHQTAILERIS